MVEITERDLTNINETHDAVIKLVTIIGDGDEGLCGEVREHTRRLSRIEMVIAGIIGSGVLGGGVFGLVKLIGG